MATITIHVQLEPEVFARFDKICKTVDRSRQYVARRMIEAGIKSQEKKIAKSGAEPSTES